MSRVSTWVQGTDEHYYKNPVIEKEGFFICFDDEEDPEIVVQIPVNDTNPTVFERSERYRLAADYLKSLNIPYRISKYGQTCTRLFGEFSLRPAFSVYFHLKGPLPVEIITEHEGRAQRPQGECTFYHFIGKFPR